jgi:hypothetical protein
LFLFCHRTTLMRYPGFSIVVLMLGTATTSAQNTSAPKPPVADKIHTEKQWGRAH